MKTRMQHKQIAFLGIWVLLMTLLLTFGHALGAATQRAPQTSKLTESGQNYFRRYVECYLENFRGPDFRRKMAECMNADSESGLNTFSDYDELETYLKNQYATRVRSYDAIRLDVAPGPAWEDDIDFDAPPPSAAPGGAADGSRSEYSDTNIQELGVDESDMVKTDGRFFYVASGSMVNIAAIEPDMALAAGIDLGKFGTVNSLYLYEDMLVVLYNTYTPFPKPAQDGRSYGWHQTNLGVAFCDISDPTEPVLLKAVEVEGRLVSSRRIENKLHIVQQFMPVTPPIRFYYDGGAAAREAVVAENEASVAEMTLDDLIPHYREAYPQSQSSEILPAVAPEHFYKPVDEDGGGQIATVVTFDLDRITASFKSVGMVANAKSVYASPKALYVFSDRWNDEEASDSPSRQQTEIYKFDLTGESVAAVASGRVNGTILNQFSLGEYEDVLRVAVNTRIWTRNDSEIYNHVYCLERNGTALDVIGKVENLAFGEQIYSARFIGERGFLVTFVNVDPLFTLDLSDPRSPKVVGELKIPGYSDYIHPWGENHLITIGKDAVFDGDMTWYQGVQLSVFDVTRFDRPALLHKLVIGDRGTQSEANYNHKAFTFWAEHNLLAIPVDLYEVPDKSEETPPNTYGRYFSSGLYVFRVSLESGFEKLGILPVNVSGERYSQAWARGIFVEETVYSVTPGVIHSAVVDDIDATLKALPLLNGNNNNGGGVYPPLPPGPDRPVPEPLPPELDRPGL